MNTQSNAMPESFDAQRVAPAVLSPTRPMYWSVRRELWENRSIYIAPLAVAGVFLFGFLITTFHLPARMRALSALDPAHQREAIAMPYDIAAALLMITQLLVGAFYCLALHGERRDRSILLFDNADREQLAALGDVRTPSIADLFVAVMTADAQPPSHQTTPGQAQPSHEATASQGGAAQ